MTSNVLVVPIYFDALVLDKPAPVIQAFADFSRLPYFDGDRDVNPDIPNISEAILSQPFQDQNYYLSAGIHLHWALPDALTNGKLNDKGINKFPAVPNRWLVTRTRNNLIENQWVVESDYINSDPAQDPKVTYPSQKDPKQPFQYLGRVLPLSNWIAQDTQATYLDESLTAIGYGEPAFAAFYPNSHSVFGFHDNPGALVDSIQGVQYELLGWYADSKQDYLFQWIQQSTDVANQPTVLDKQIEELKESIGWDILNQVQEFPGQMVCYARIVFDEKASLNADHKKEDNSISVAIGNTSTEALSAYLGSQIGPQSKSIIEDQLEALNLAAGLENKRLDLGPGFQEARHTKGFSPASGGRIWTLRPENESGSQAANPANLKPEQVTLDLKLADLLNKLNDQQQAYDQALQEIYSLREQMFADWYKYMLSTYPPPDSLGDYPNEDEVKLFIEQNDILPLQRKISAFVTLKSKLDKAINKLSTRVLHVAMSDILDWNEFLKELGNTSILALDERLLASTIDPVKQKALIIKQLNKRISQRNFHSSFDKDLPDFSSETKGLLLQLNQLPVSSSRQVWMRLNHLLLESLFPGQIAHHPNYILKKVSAPRYWHPNEPVVLLSGASVKPTRRYGTAGELYVDDLLQCKVLSMDTWEVNSAGAIENIRQAINLLDQTLGQQIWKEQPWNPIMLEWEVEFFPTDDGNNLNSPSHTYASDFIARNFQLDENKVDLTVLKGQEKNTPAANVYSGRSILTPHARLQLNQRLENYLNHQILKQYYKVSSTRPEEQSRSFLGQQIGDIRSWYEKQPPAQDQARNGTPDPILTAILAYEKLQGINVLAQSLGGFNQALVMHKQTLQLPIADPIGFDDRQQFSNIVNAAVGNSNRSAPQPLNNFNPIRAGELRLLRLRLIDTFGQVRDIGIHIENLITTDLMAPPEGSSNPVWLPPRLAQPARLNFRWLSASGLSSGGDEAEINDHPATSPICGWILPNNLDNSLMVYAQSGQALGLLDQNGVWHSAPGSTPILLGNITNPHLNKLITYLSAQNKQDKLSNPDEAPFLEEFLIAIERALENIDPVNFFHNEALALLMGRPIAVVRATLSFELQGRPAINQDWNIFRQDMQKKKTAKGAQRIRSLVRQTDEFTKVKFPVRIGEYRQLNDALVGYWIEDGEGYLGNKFYAPQTPNAGLQNNETIDHPDIITHQPNRPANLSLSIADPARILTMLLDPRGVVHASCGILPTKSINIPTDQFADSLRAIEVTFLSAPIITDVGKINLPLPNEAGYVWSWLEKENGIWADESEIGPITPQAKFGAKQEVREGWLKISQAKK